MACSKDGDFILLQTSDMGHNIATERIANVTFSEEIAEWKISTF